jgi:hypothetical protein
MRKETAFVVVTGLFNIVFQISLAVYPQYLQQHAWILKYLWVFLAGCLTTLVLVNITRKSSSKARPVTRTAETKSESTIRDSGNSTVNLNIGPVPSPLLAPPSAAPPRKHIEVETLELLTAEITEGSDSKFTFSEKNENSVTALLLPVHFDAIKSDPGTEMLAVGASLVFTNSVSGQKIRIAHAIWIDGSRVDTQDILAGETKHVIVAILHEGKAKAFGTKSAGLDWAPGAGVVGNFEDSDLPIARYNLELVLRWWKEKRVFEIVLEENKLFV